MKPLQLGDCIYHEKYKYGIVFKVFCLQCVGIFFFQNGKSYKTNDYDKLKITRKMNYTKFAEELKNEHT